MLFILTGLYCKGKHCGYGYGMGGMSGWGGMGGFGGMGLGMMSPWSYGMPGGMWGMGGSGYGGGKLLYQWYCSEYQSVLLSDVVKKFSLHR